MTTREVETGSKILAAAGAPLGLLGVLKNRRLHQVLAASALILSAGMAGAANPDSGGGGGADAGDSNSTDSGSEESPCDKDGDGECDEGENAASGDAVEQNESEMPRDEGTCEGQGGSESGENLEEGTVHLRPVNWETGEKWETATDLTVRLPGGDYRFTRQYTSDGSRADNPYDLSQTFPGCISTGNISANVGAGWGWSNLRAATGKQLWNDLAPSTAYERAGVDITIFRPARKTKRINGAPGSVGVPINGAGNQYIDGIFPTGDVDPGTGDPPSPCYDFPQSITYNEPGRWTQTFDLSSNGIGWITEDVDEFGNTRLYEDTDSDSQALPDRILFNGTSTSWSDPTNLVDAWIEIKWEDDRLVRADVYRPSSTGGVITQTVQYYHIVEVGGVKKVKYHDGTSYITLVIPGTSTEFTASDDLGTDGDLVMVVRSTAIDPGNGSTDWRRQVTQYRYHDNSAEPGSGDIRQRVEGAEHQLKSVFRPQQIEYMAEQRSSDSSPDDMTMVEEAIDLLAIDDDASYDGASGPLVYEVANKIVTYDGITDRVEWQIVQSGNCGCGSGGSTNAVALNYEWHEGWEGTQNAHPVDGISLHMREYGLTSFTSWPTTVYRSFAVDMMELRPDQPYVRYRAQIAGDIPSGATSDAWVWTRNYAASTTTVSGANTPSSISSYTPADSTQNPKRAPSVTVSTTGGLVSDYIYGGENIGNVSRGVHGDTDLVIKRTYVDDGVEARKKLLSKIERPVVAGTTDGDEIQVTEFDYGYEDTTTAQLDWKRTRVEREIEDENGPSGDPEWAEYWEFYDDRGQLTWSIDAGGVVTRYEYDDWTGTLTKVTRNAYYANWTNEDSELVIPDGTGGAPINPFPSGEPSGGQLVTEYERDLRGRVTKVTRPGGVESWTIRGMDTDAERMGIQYYSIVTMPHQVESPGEYAGPASKRLMDASSATIRSERWDVEDDSTYDPGSESYSTNGALIDTTELARTVTNHDIYGQITSKERWWDITNDLSMTTSYEYDAYGRQSKITDGEGTVTLTTYDVLDRAIELEVGTSAANAVTVAEFIYDGDSAAVSPAAGVGNGNITTLILHEDASTTRKTRMYYDDRDRLIGTVLEDGPMSLTKYDNLDRPIEQAVYGEPGSLPSELNLKNIAAESDDLPVTNADDADLPTGITRSWYTKTHYSQRGMVWKSQTAIDASLGTPTFLESLFWFDEDANALASWSPNSGLDVRKYDAHDRVTTVYVTDRLGLPTELDIYDTAGEKVADAVLSSSTVLEQAEYTYTDGDGMLEMMTAYSRPHNATATGSLSSSTAITSYIGYIYDDALRGVATVNFGTNQTTFSTAGSAPTLSSYDSLDDLDGADDVLFTWRTYNERGLVEDVIGMQEGTTSADFITTRYLYDDAYRTIGTIENYDDASLSWSSGSNRYTSSGLDITEPAEDRITSYVYDDVDHVIKRVAHLPKSGGGEDVQITEYDYGVTNGSASNVTDSLVNSNNLLLRVRYPKEDTGLAAMSSDDDFIVEYGFNRLGELRGIEDQNSTVRELERDKQGRVKADIVNDPGDYVVNSVTRDVDDAVRRIGYTFDSLGRLTDIESFTDTAGTTVRDEVEIAYTKLWQVESIAQQHDGAVTGTSPTVEYEYTNSARANATGNYSRLTGVVYPTDSASGGSGDTIEYSYNSGIDDRISRVSKIGIDDFDPTTAGFMDLIEYERIGLDLIAEATLPEIDIMLDRTVDHEGDRFEDTNSVTTQYPGFDQFGRITRHMWAPDDFGPHATQTTPPLSNKPAVLEVTHTYDRSSNRLTYNDAREKLKLENLNRAFSYDKLNRLVEELRTDAGTNSYAPLHNSRQWTLDTLGNWDSTNIDYNNDGDYLDGASKEYLDSRNHNAANEIKPFGRTIAITGSGFTIYSNGDNRYDDTGNMTDDRRGSGAAPNPPPTTLEPGLVHTYDAWNRLVKTEYEDSSSTRTTIAEYTYNGLGWRTTKEFDVSQGAHDGLDQKRVFLYDASWRIVEEWIDTDVDTDSDSTGGTDDDTDWVSQQFWGIRYIDDAVAKRVDRDADGSWIDTECSQWYQITDTQFSVCVILDADGYAYERIDYDAYGNAAHRYAGDSYGNDAAVDGDDLFSGGWLAAANKTISDTSGAYDPELDIDFSGTITVGTGTEFEYAGNAGYTAIPDYWIGDPASTTGPDNSIGYAGYVFNHEREDYSVRFRVYSTKLGKWMTKDPLGYIDSSNAYAYVINNPLGHLDSYGLSINAGKGGGTGGTSSGPAGRQGSIYYNVPGHGSPGNFETDYGGVVVTANDLLMMTNENLPDAMKDQFEPIQDILDELNSLPPEVPVRIVSCEVGQGDIGDKFGERLSKFVPDRDIVLFTEKVKESGENSDTVWPTADGDDILTNAWKRYTGTPDSKTFRNGERVNEEE